MSDNNNNSDPYMQDEPDSSGSHPKHKRKKKKEREIKFIPYSEDNESSSEKEDIYKRSSDDEDHFQIKVLVEETRKKFGSGWLLHNVSPSFLPTSDGDGINCLPSPKESSSVERNLVLSCASANNTSPQNKSEYVRTQSVTSPGIYTSSSAFSPVLTEDSESETENGDESELFFAHHYTNDTPLMLSLGQVYFVENDGMSGKKIHRWFLSSIQSAELVQEENKACVILKFTSLILDKQERKYIMEGVNSAKTLLKLLEPHLSKNSHENATDGALQCVNCQSEFSKSLVENFLLQKTWEKADGEVSQELKKIRKCPNCGSMVLLELFHKPSTPANIVYSKDVAITLDNSNILGNMGSSPTMRPRSVSVVNSINEVKLQPEGNDSTSSSSIECILMEDGFEKSTVRSQSDITVLTNPSQSSFAIISQSDSSLSNASNQAEDLRPDCSNHDASRIVSSPVDIAQRRLSLDSPWYDSSSTKTTLVQSPSPKAWNLSELQSSIVSCSPTSTEHGLSSKQSQKVWQMLEQKEKAIVSPIRINHQIKLHMEVNVFDDEEEFVAGINGVIVLDSTKQEVMGVLIVSTCNVYIFEENDNLNTDSSPVEELQKFSLRSLSNVCTLLGSQGFSLHFSSNSTVLVILKDADICNSFVVSLESNLKDIFGKVNSTTLPRFQLLMDEIMLNVRKEILEASSELGSEFDQDVNLFLLGSVQRSSDTERKVESVAFIVTSQCLYLASLQYFSEPHNPALHFQLMESQEIGNLTEVHLNHEMNRASFHFLDEDVGEEEYWLFKAESKSSLASVLVTLKTPWEELFAIDLELSLNKDCICGL